MSLVQIQSLDATGLSAVDLVGITTDCVYMVVANNVKSSSDRDYYSRVLKSSSADTTSNYDYLDMTLRNDSSFNKNASINNDKWVQDYIGDDVSEAGNLVHSLYNFYNSSEYSFVITENVAGDNANPTIKGRQGTQVHTVASSSNGITYFVTSGTFTSGIFTLYKQENT